MTLNRVARRGHRDASPLTSWRCSDLDTSSGSRVASAAGRAGGCFVFGGQLSCSGTAEMTPNRGVRGGRRDASPLTS
jgi:hypothetical protein